MLRRLLRWRRRVHPTDWFQSVDEPADDPADSAITEAVRPRPARPRRRPESFVETLLEGDPALEATLRGVRKLRSDGREAVRRRYITLEDLRAGSADDLAALDGIGATMAGQVMAAAQSPTSLVAAMKGLRSEAADAVCERFPSVGALASAARDELTALPGIGPATAKRIQTAAREWNGREARSR